MTRVSMVLMVVPSGGLGAGRVGRARGRTPAARPAVSRRRRRCATGMPLVSDVVDGRAAARLLDDLAQLRVVGVALDVEGDPDLLVAVADRAVGQAEDAEQVDVALDGRADLGEVRRRGRRRCCAMPGGQAGGEGVQQVLDRGRRVVGARRAPRGGRRSTTVTVLVLHLLHGAVEAVDLRPAVGAALPGVAGAELELRDLRVVPSPRRGWRTGSRCRRRCGTGARW